MWLGMAAAAVDGADKSVHDAEQSLSEVERSFAANGEDEQSYAIWSRAAFKAKSAALECVADSESAHVKLAQDIASLGEKVAGEAVAVGRQRETLSMQLAVREQQIAQCRLLGLRADELLQQMNERRQQLLADRLFTPGPHLLEVLRENWQEPAAWLTSTATFLLDNSGLEHVTATMATLLVVLLAIAVTAGVRVRMRWKAKILAQTWDDDFAGRFNCGWVAVAAHYFPHILVSTIAALVLAYALRGTTPLPFINVVAYGLPVLFLVQAAIRGFFAPVAPGELFLPIDAVVGQALARRLLVLAVLVFLGYLSFSTLLAQSLPESALLLARAVFAVALVLNLIWALWLVGRIPALAETLWLRGALWLVFLAILVAEILGYRNLSIFALRAVMGSLVALALFLLLSRLLRELWDGLDHGRHRWQAKLRKGFNIEEGAPLPGLIWLRFIAGLVLWAVLLVVVLRLWGLSDAVMQKVHSYLVDGFPIGSLHIVPARVLLALIFFVLLLGLSGWVKSRMERNWLTRTPMDRGARESLVAVSGYVGVAIAGLVALGVAGMQFSNLAIIAGALSLGIGFGLQNIVNNFVSGLILLFERPIKSGDWIVVGSTEGFVKRIRIRSTLIQTFDRADVIVPNSELISGQVVNWMLDDPRGRITVYVGVAYGSDTEKVKRLLLEAAAQHPLVIKGVANWEPKVLFMAFGESSLNFELRVFIREIDRRFDVVSDINFAIDGAFRREGVEIPFPQRDLHVKNWPRDPISPSATIIAGDVTKGRDQAR